MAQIITIYSANVGAERGIGQIMGFYSSHSDAVAKAKGHGWYGGDGDVFERLAIRLDSGAVYLLDRDHKKPIDLDDEVEELRLSAKKRALAKLDPDEIAALGLDKEE